MTTKALPTPDSPTAKDQITGISPEDFRPMAWGGWGLRFKRGGRTLSLAGDRAAVIQETSGRRTLIVVNQTEQLAEALREIHPRGATR